MIPYECADDAPPGERELFEKLRDAPNSEGWVAFHSLNIARHATRVEGEADFVVIAPGHGILVIEVKSHERVETDGQGRWKLGVNDWTIKSPFDQASGAMHSIAQYLDSKGTNPIGYPVWYAVWFTAIATDRLPQSIGWQQWAMLGANDLRSGDVGGPITRVLKKASDHLLATVPSYRRVEATPSDKNVARAVEILEPRFVTTITPAEAARRRAEDLEKYTKEQRAVLDMLAEVPRLLVEGPAGSGKTILAIEAARRAADRGERVLFVVYNRLIEAEIKLKCEGVDVFRMHSLMAELCGESIPRDADTDWYDALPARAFEAAMEGQARYDLLVIDEAQDLSDDRYLDVLDSLLIDGLEVGRSVVTGDFALQNVYVKAQGDAPDGTREVFRRRVPSAVPLKLKVNTRNTPELGEFFESLTQKTGIYSEFLRADDEQVSVHLQEYVSSADQDELLAAAVEQILSEPFTIRELVILSPVRNSAARRAQDAKLRSRLGADISDLRLIRWGTIHEFKGMEAPAVILTDIDDSNRHLESLLYVGMTRATDRLIVLKAKS